MPQATATTNRSLQVDSTTLTCPGIPKIAVCFSFAPLHLCILALKNVSPPLPYSLMLDVVFKMAAVVFNSARQPFA